MNPWRQTLACEYKILGSHGSKPHCINWPWTTGSKNTFDKNCWWNSDTWYNSIVIGIIWKQRFRYLNIWWNQHIWSIKYIIIIKLNQLMVRKRSLLLLLVAVIITMKLNSHNCPWTQYLQRWKLSTKLYNFLEFLNV